MVLPDWEGIELLEVHDARRQDALRVLLSGSAIANPKIDERIGRLYAVVAAQGLDASLLVAAWRGPEIVAACLAVESPGRTAMLYLSPTLDAVDLHNYSVRMLGAIQEHAWPRGILMLQSLLSEVEAAWEGVYREAGFQALAELIYLDRPRGTPAPRFTEPSALKWVRYVPSEQELFIRALKLTYVESLDCPLLSGVREPADVLAGHRATGLHDPSLWFVALDDRAPAGILLLSPVNDRDVLEVVYMGVTWTLRGRAWARTLLGKACQEASARGFSALTLAVDSANVPALRLYQRWGFVEAARRRAWIALRPR